MRRFAPWIVFACILAMLIVIEARPAFPDPDSFYHAKMALLMRDQGFIHQFPWLAETVFAEHYVDHHLLYHILLIPFVTLFDPMVGMKVSAVVFGLVAFYALYQLLKSFHAPWPEWLTFAAALSTSFLHRMSLPRAPSLSFAFLAFGIWAMVAKKPLHTFLCAVVFVWFYNGWPILLAAYLAVFVADLVASRLAKQAFDRHLLHVGGALVGGLVAGLIVNPYFPANIAFNFLHIIKIGLFNGQNTIRVGQEWLPTSFSQFLNGNVIVLAVCVLAFGLFFSAAAWKKRVPTKDEMLRAFTGLFLTAGFTFLTFRSARYIEYALPCLVLAAGSLLVFSAPLIREIFFPTVWQMTHRRPLFTGMVAGLVVAAIGVGVYQEIRSIVPGPDYFQAKQYQSATEWIRANVPTDDLVFHNGWDYSMVLFYLDVSHRYLVGLDPMFMYDQHPDRYNEWMNLSNGTDPDVSKIITEFNTRTVIVDSRIGGSLAGHLDQSPLFEKVNENAWVRVYAAK